MVVISKFAVIVLAFASFFLDVEIMFALCLYHSDSDSTKCDTDI